MSAWYDWQIWLLALALAADAFSVGAAVGVSHRRAGQVFRMSWHFGLFQALMPLVGASAGAVLQRYVEPWSGWLVFAVLTLVGGKMIVESRRSETRPTERDLTRGLSLVALSIAVSIDALGAGVALGLAGAPLIAPVVIIGLTAAVLTAVGMLLAGRIREVLGRRCELVGGLVLIGLGVRALL
ncbi:MAG: manganese efflux pump MntP family protein [Polyangia bacterium]